MGESDVKVHLLTFRTSKNRTIIVRVHEHKEHSLHVLKFFDKNHRFSNNKYSLLNSDGEASAIINTNIAILLYFYQKNPFASFAFMGAPTQEEAEKNSQTKKHFAHDTKRFRLYRRIMSLFFNPVRFAHIQNPLCSAYLIANRDYLNPNTDATLKSMIQRLKTAYPDEIEEDGFE